MLQNAPTYSYIPVKEKLKKRGVKFAEYDVPAMP